jgi:hypothetical protein
VCSSDLDTGFSGLLGGSSFLDSLGGSDYGYSSGLNLSNNYGLGNNFDYRAVSSPAKMSPMPIGITRDGSGVILSDASGGRIERAVYPQAPSPSYAAEQSRYVDDAMLTTFIGDYSGAKPNALGVGGSVAFGLTGLDFYKDAADWGYGIQNWEWSWGHAGNQALNTIAFLPVVGAVKNLKHVDELAGAGKAVVKNLDEAATVGKVYDVGLANDLRKSGIPNTQVNHLPQSRQAESLIGNFNPVNKVGNEPAIRLPISEHEAVNAAQRMRTAPASARDLLADEIRILRNNTNVPNSQLQKVIELNRKQHPTDYLPLHRTNP